ncbi:uncharacterized mitochondrial protein AtMg01250-like [Rutidosis leptorrhynchoides]|uniref:uncharacterized mitochondrial protein AtMg01250-like n=1 Tax=Rutidosis leptorrhynchoides TaxID=125765 RepID=UPI003A99678D
MGVMGFGNKWLRWISMCHTCAQTSVLINGSPTGEVQVQRGLRQGDPLSPFIFLIIMEGLCILIRDSVRDGRIRGAHIGNPEINISHLFYTDDVVVVSDWHQEILENTLNVFNNFYVCRAFK